MPRYLEPRPGDIVSAGADLGLRIDSSALVVSYLRDGLHQVAEIVELRPEPGKPLKPTEVCATFVDVMQSHGCSYCCADHHYRMAIEEALENSGLQYCPGPSSPVDAFIKAKALMRDGLVRLPNHGKLLRQMRETVSSVTTGGRVSIQHPRNSGGHGDIVSAFVLSLWLLGSDEIPHPEPMTYSREWEEQQREQRRRRLQEEKEKTWWERNGASDRGPSAWWKR